MFGLRSVLKQGRLCLITFFLLSHWCVFSQTPVLDRGVLPDNDARNAGLDSNAADGSLIGDDFTLGREGEVWVIDRIRTWVSTSTASSAAFGDLFQEISFLGGLANDPPAAECVCHNLLSLKTGTLSEKGSANPDIAVSPGSMPDQWQVDFQNFRWSVPGGTKVQFAIKAVPRRNSQGTKLRLTAVPVQGEHSLRIFTHDGGFRSFLGKKAQNSGGSLAISIQVWAHLAR